MRKKEIKASKQLYNKLLMTYTAIIAGVVLVLVVYFLFSMRGRILETNLDYTKMMQEEAVGYLEETADIASGLHEELYRTDMEISDVLHYLQDDEEEYRKYRLNKYAETKINEYRGIETFVGTAFELHKTLKRISFVSYEKGDFTAYTGKSKVLHVSDGSRYAARINTGNLASNGEFSFQRELKNPVTMKPVGVIVFTFDGQTFKEIQEYYSRAELVVYNKYGTAVFDSEKRMTTEEISDIENEELLSDMLDAYVEREEVEGYYSLTYLQKNRAAIIPLPIIIMIFLVGGTVVAAGIMLVRYYLRRLMGRLNRILDGMTKVMGGALDERLPVDERGDELDIISRHFNELCVKLDEHIQKQYLAEIEQKNAEMAALQSQINPHFLYNTLEAIRMKAICNGDREVGKMLYSMAVTFRSQIKEADIITLAQELHYCKKYMELFEYRYQGQFKSSVECLAEYLQIPIIKFVLQPVIENYFIHGIRMGEENNFIGISVEKREEDYYIIVEDNGKGMTEKEMEEKNRKLRENDMPKSSSIGISNVNRRLKAVYGREYGITLEAAETGGVRVILKFKPDGEDRR